MAISFRWAIASALLVNSAAFAQASRVPNGHWQGSLKMGKDEQPMVMDLTKDQKGEWIGTLGIPEFGINDVPIATIAVAADGVRIAAPSFPGAPSLDLKLSPDAKSMSGSLTSGGTAKPVTFKRTGEAKVNLPGANSTITKSLEGAWQGSMDGGGTSRYHLVLKFQRAANGTGSGTVTSIDRNMESPLSAIRQEGNFVTFEILSLGGTFRGTLNAAATALNGEWMQGGNGTPLNFSRGASTQSANSAMTKALEGTWRGKIDQGPEFRIELVMKLKRAADGSATGTMASSEAKSKELPLSAIVIKGNSVQFEVGLLKASFKGALDASGGSITGRWTQEGLLENLPLTFQVVR